jgi:hypothetical protein
LKKDFSNWNEVVSQFSDASLRRSLTDRAYDDLIASGRYTYRQFIHQFDDDLERAGRAPGALRVDGDDSIQNQLRGNWKGQCRAAMLWALRQPFPGRTRAVKFVRRIASR